MSRDVLVLGGDTQILQPDALEDYSGSVESSVIGALITKAYAPAGPNGEIVFRRLDVTGYHRDRLELWLTPIVDGRFISELRTFVYRSAPQRSARFHVEAALGERHPDYEGTSGLRGSALQAFIEWEDPVATFHLESVTFVHEPLTDVRATRVDE